MKKVILLVVFAFMAIGAKAKTAGMFSYDSGYVEKVFATVDVVDHYLDAHPVDLETLKQTFSNPAAEGEKPLGIPGFVWGAGFSIIGGFIGIKYGGSLYGFLAIMGGCGLFGVLLTYMLTEDKKQTRNALLGCVTGSGAFFLAILLLAIGYGAGSGQL